MLGFRNCRILASSANQSNVLISALNRVFSSKGKDPKTYTVTVTVPRDTEKKKKWDEHANWELLGRRGYRFILPGSVGLSPMRRRSIAWKKVSRPKKTQYSEATLPDTNYYRQIVTQLAVMAAELSFMRDVQREFQCKAVDCPFLLREQVIDLFPKAGLGYGPLTAVCVALRCIPKESISDNDWQSITKKFEDTARRVCGKLNQAGFWADFPTKIQFDMSSDESIDTSASQIEAANLLLSPGPRVMHISGCIILLHPPKGESRVLGWLFTTAPFDDAKLMDIIDDENA